MVVVMKNLIFVSKCLYIYTKFSTMKSGFRYSMMLILFFFGALVWHEGSGQTIISNGTDMIISSGTTVVSNQNLDVNSGGDLNVLGTLVLKKDLINQNASPDNLGTGTIEFSGTTLQNISGQNIIGNMTVNNSAGITLSGNTQVNGTLTLTNGLITLGSNNLLLGPSATVSGTPSATKMIVATGTGELRKEFSGTGSFTFPVGDNTSTAEYSPVTLNFASGSFGSGNYAGVKLADAKYSHDSIQGSYLTRNWTVTQNAISGFSCSATFKYLDSDITGTESAIYCVKVSPDPWITYSAANTGTNELSATGLSSFSTFTGAKPAHDVDLTAFLEGPFSSGVMTTTLQSSGLIPITQPFNTAPWNYAGAESVVSVPAGVVDWVLLELRQADQPANATSATIIKKRAAFLKSDGSIVELDGTSPVRFYNATITQNLYPVVRHRNHLSIMANNAVTKSSGIYTYDFSTALSQAYGGALGYKQIASSPDVFGMVTGDINQDGSVYTTDFDLWAASAGSANVYNSSDLNLDGNVYTSDYDKWATNSGTSHPLNVPVIIKYQSKVPE